MRAQARLLVMAGCCTGLMLGGAEAAPRVVASIQPIHSLVAGVMEGVGSPSLLMQPGASPHSYQLRPSQAKALREAQLIVWVGEDLEVFLTKPVQSLGGSAKVLGLMQAAGVELLPVREGGGWEPHEHGEGEQHEDEHGEGEHDAHVWLSPANARAIVRATAQALSEIDPAGASRYAANAEALTSRIEALEAEMRAELAPVHSRPFIVFHDAYQYLERAFDLRAVGSITVSPERQPGARRLQELRAKIRDEGASCVFGEPQVRTGLVQTLIEGTNAAAGELDAEGGPGIESGTEAYFTLMRRNAKALSQCLARQS